MQFSWAPWRGCSAISPGCQNCKATKGLDELALRDLELDAVITRTANGAHFNGNLRLQPHRLDAPLRIMQPHVVYVLPMADLFHETAPGDWIDAVFGIVERARWHTFCVLTKRSDRMHGYMRQRYSKRDVPKNVALGVSVERQREADERIPLLRDTPAAIRYVSIYPMLGAIDLRAYLAKLSFVHAGHEIERPADPAWLRRVRNDCEDAGVPFAEDSTLVSAESPLQMPGADFAALHIG